MGKPHPIELRERVVAHVEEGRSHRSAAARCRVSVKFVNDMMILKRETGRFSRGRRAMVAGTASWKRCGAGSGRGWRKRAI